ncbi:MAG: YARHG domain-containing protein [Cyclobacteriaceae bacterium]|nr:YARHG domain-containing protein [Cyclobacteriaceae bacterium]
MRSLFLLSLVSLLISCDNGKDHPAITEQRHSGYPRPLSTPHFHSVVVEGLDLLDTIREIDLGLLNKSDLGLLRNEIYARRGYTFSSSELLTYFSEFDWYQPKFSTKDVDKLLNDTDRYNIDLIRSYEAKRTISWDTQVQNYLELIPLIKLPLQFVCEEGFSVPEINYENEYIQKYKPEGAAIIGLLYQNKETAAILYGYPADIFYPIISEIDLNGRELAEVRLFPLGDCVGDEGYDAKTYGTITKEFEVHTRTVIYTWDPETGNTEKDSTVSENVIYF